MVASIGRHPGPVLPHEVDWTSQAWRKHPLARGLQFWFQPSVRRLGNVVSGDMMTPSTVRPTMTHSPGWGMTGLFDRANQTHLQSNQALNLTASFTYRTVISGTDASGVGATPWLAFHNYYGAGTTPDIGHYYKHNSGIYANSLAWYDGTYYIAKHSSLPANVFSDLVITYNHITGDAISYINGAYDQTTSSLSPMVYPILSPRIGSHEDSPASAFDGHIAITQLWDRVLSAAEAQYLHAPQTRWSLVPGRSTRRYLITSSPTTTIIQRRRPGISCVGSRSIAC